MDSPEEKVAEASCGATFEQTLSLPSAGAAFIKLEPTVAEQ